MKVLEENLRKGEGEIKLIPETIEDLWHLRYIIEPGDIVFSLTKRVTESSDKLRSDKETVIIRMGIEVEKVEFHKFANRLRISGKIISGIDQSGYHTINITEGKELSIIKKWKDEQLKRIRDAVELSNKPEVVIVTIEEGEAIIGMLKQWGIEEIGVIKGSYGKDRGDNRREFFGEVYSALKNLNFKYLVIAGPGFAKNDFYNFIKEKDASIDAVIVDTSSIGTRGFIEVLKRGVIDRIVGEIKIARDAEFIDKLLEEISKNGKAVYGMDDVKKAFEYGAIETLLVTDEFLREQREKWDIDSFLRDVENMNAEIVIMSSEFEPGKRLNALGGIAALLRFRI